MTAKKELRDYDQAILHSMEDGQVHLREALMKVGCAAIDQQYALTMYQKANKGRLEDWFAGLNHEQRMEEIERQRYEGARLQVGKRLSHLESAGLIEVVEWAPPRPGRKRKQRVSFRITEKGLARVRGVSDEEIDKTWEQEAREVVVAVAQRLERLTIEDVWGFPLRKPLTVTRSPLEPVFSWAIRQGYLLFTDETVHNQANNSTNSVYESLIVGVEEVETLKCAACEKPVDPLEPGTSREALVNIEVPPRKASRTRTNAPFGTEPTGNHWCVDCSKALRNNSRRGHTQGLRQRVRDKLITRV